VKTNQNKVKIGWAGPAVVICFSVNSVQIIWYRDKLTSVTKCLAFFLTTHLP